MDNWTFGITVSIIGMVGTMLVLWGVSLLILLLRRLFPVRPEPKGPQKASEKASEKA